LRSSCPAIVFFAVLFLSPGIASAKGEKSAKLQGYDVISRPGQKVKVKAKLERVIKGLSLFKINPDVSAEPLAFFLMEQPITDPRYAQELPEPKYLGRAKTNGSGFAELDFTPKRTGNYLIEARVQQGSKYMALPGPLLVSVCSSKEPILVCDLDQTLAAVSAMKSAISDAKNINTLPGARDGIWKLYKNYRVIYLTERDDTFIPRTRAWLRSKKMPPGPVFYWDFWSKSWSSQTFKTKLVSSLRKTLPGLALGIGDTKADAEAYISNGLTAHILIPEPGDDFPEFALTAKKWTKLTRNIKRQRKAEALLAGLEELEPAKRQESWRQLLRFGPNLKGFTNRFRSSTKLSTAAAATQLLGRLRAREAFLSAFNQSSPGAALNSLVAAWRQGDPWIISRLYAKPDVALGDCAPPLANFTSVTVVKRDEPAPGQIHYQLRLEGAGATKAAKIVLLQGKDEKWYIVAEDM